MSPWRVCFKTYKICRNFEKGYFFKMKALGIKPRAVARVTKKMTRKMMTRVTKFLSGRAAGSFFGRPGSFTGDPNKWRHSLFWKKFAEYDRFTAHSILLFSLGVFTRLPHHTMTPHDTIWHLPTTFGRLLYGLYRVVL